MNTHTKTARGARIAQNDKDEEMVAFGKEGKLISG